MVRRRGDERGLATFLFTDIVGSSDVATELGDQRWHRLQARHHAVVRKQLKRHEGHEVDTAGDGFFITFSSPTRGVRCAFAIVREVRELGLDVRAGLHIGEAELTGEKIGGIAVTIASRVGALAGAGEVLVTATIESLVVGSGLAFKAVGRRELKGVPGGWELFRLTEVDGTPLPPPLSVEEATAARKRAVPTKAPTRVGRRRLVASATTLAVALVVTSLVVAEHRRSPARATTASSSSSAPEGPVIALDAATGQVIHAVAPVGSHFSVVVLPPYAADAVQTFAWVMGEHVGYQDGYLQTVDRASGNITNTPGERVPSCLLAIDCLAYGEGRVWVVGFRPTEGGLFAISVQGVDVTSIKRHEPTTIDRVSGRSTGLVETFGDGAVWVGNTIDGEIYRMDPKTLDVQRRSVPEVDALAFGEGSLWVLDELDQEVIRVDPKTLQPTGRVKVSGDITQLSRIAVGGGYVWVTDAANSAVLRIPNDTNLGDAGRRIKSISVGTSPEAVAYDGGSQTVWVGNVGDRSVSVVDPGSGQEIHTYDLGDSPRSIAVGDGQVWIST